MNTAKLSNIYGLIVYSFYVFSFNFSKTPRPINYYRRARIKKLHTDVEHGTGAPSDGFLLNALKSLFRLSRPIKSTPLRSLEMHSKRRYKIGIRSVILGGLESFRDYKGFSVIFPKPLDTIERFTKERIFLIPLFITFLKAKILGLLFLRKLAWHGE